MKIVNELYVYDPGESAAKELPPGLEVPDFEKIYAPYGYKAATTSRGLKWTLATQEDYRRIDGKLKNIPPGDVQICDECAESCSALCAAPDVCTGIMEPGTYILGCHCWS